MLVAALYGSIQRVFGSGQPALIEPPSSRAGFEQPQGLARSGSARYVADTENHAIRSIDFDTGMVTTLAGTGEQALQAGPGGPAARSTPLSSPWDLALARPILYIAMAGTHQIWSLRLDVGTVGSFAGTGREGLLDGALDQAWFAQSSGLALADGHLDAADAESARCATSTCAPTR